MRTISSIMIIITDILFILDGVLAMYYKFKKKDTGEAVWYLVFALMMMVTHLLLSI